MASGVDELLTAWVREEWERQPTQASALGADGYDHRLGDFSSSAFEQRPERDRHYAGLVERLSLPELPVDERVDLVAVLAELAGRQVMDDWQLWRREPAVYLGPCLGGVHEPWLHRLRPEPELVDGTVARLAEIPGVLADARANLDPALMPALFARRGEARARAGARYIAASLPGEASDPEQRDRLAAATAAPVSALEAFADWLAEVGPRAAGDWAIGEARYSALLTGRELLGVDAAGLHQRGVAAFDQLDAQMAEVAARIDPRASGWPEVLAALDADCPDTPEEMRAAYERSCDEARAFLIERDLVTLPEGERCLVEPSPLYQRPVLAVASYQSPPPLSPSLTGHFFVPYPPDGERPEAIRERLANNGYHAVPTTAVHEAYPGHHWQLVWSRRTTRLVRHLVTTSYFVEGWALYAEAMMHEQGFFTDDRQVLSHLGARIFRAARIVVDTALHTGAMTVAEAESFMRDRAGLPGAVARAEVERYCSWPTQAASYLTGCLQIEELRSRWTGDLRAFHDSLAANPGLPVALAAELLLAG